MPPRDRSSSDWRDLYAAVRIEEDPADLACLLSLCEAAIFRRLRKLDFTPENEPERVEMLAASVYMLKVRIKRLGWPDPTR